jgi:hypothetical protein
VQEETPCPHCGKLTHTRYGWRYDFPGYDTDVYGIATWFRMIFLIVAAILVSVFLFPWYWVLAGVAVAGLWWWLLG